MKKEVEVVFETITPLWTGDAWGECKEIRPSSLIGSLRFWFEVICYFSGVCNGDDFNASLRRFEKEVNRKKLKEFIEENGNNIEVILKYLANDQEIPIPAIVFGTTNWRSLIEIKSITPIKDYCFGNKLNLPYSIGIKKENLKIEEYKLREDWLYKINSYSGKYFKDKLNNAKKEYSFFFFPHPYFYGKFKVIFKVEEKILESIFYPLLNFMEKYGFWGGKWNIGYGRLKVLKVEEKEGESWEEKSDWRKDEFNFEIFNDKDKLKFRKIKINDVITEKILNKNSDSSEFLKEFLEVDNFHCNMDKKLEEIKNKIPKNITFLNIEDLKDKDFLNLIKELLKIKVKMRNCLRHECEKLFEKCFEGKNGKKEFKPDKEILCNSKKIKCNELKLWRNLRHRLLGSRGGDGSKILPFICKEGSIYKGGFISIAGVLNLYENKGESK
ncbi:type III-B CRISPR module RAMP protein Cmr1 [Methanocaldococcus infernus]|nr:type III-B CRISPR module RAMP protein Cmr1 [Methanocaldococcus infernus]